jgi:hypothetical protein
MWFRKERQLGAEESQKALDDSRKALEKIRARGPQVSEVAEKITYKEANLARHLHLILDPGGH